MFPGNIPQENWGLLRVLQQEVVLMGRLQTRDRVTSHRDCARPGVPRVLQTKHRIGKQGIANHVVRRPKR